MKLDGDWETPVVWRDGRAIRVKDVADVKFGGPVRRGDGSVRVRDGERVVGGGSVILKDVPPFMMIEGQPAKARGINSEGLKRRGFTPEEIGAVKDAYKLIYMSDLLMADVKLKLAEMAVGSAHCARLLAFIESSTRSIVR